MIQIKKYFSMIELLVGMAVLAIMMTFLINAFSSAEQIASSGRRSMDTFEKSNMTLDFMAGDLNQLSVNDAPRLKVPFQHTNSSIEFICRLPFDSNPTDRQKLKYSYSSNVLSRERSTLEKDINGEPKFPEVWVSQGVEILLSDIKSFKLECFDSQNTLLGQGVPLYTYPGYIELELTLNNPQDSNEVSERTFTRRIYFE